LAAAQAKVAAAQAAVEKARADRFQNWEMQAGYSHDNSTGFDTGGISVSIPLPLYNRNQGAISQADAELRAAQAEVGRVALDLRNRLALVFERYANAKEMVDRYEKSILPDAKEAIELNSHRYRAGEGSFPSLLLSQRDYLRTEVSYLDALRELRETSVLLQGLLLSDSLPGAAK
jgi:cobalt-zinc-cadmium efflux system outer membrane protein